MFKKLFILLFTLFSIAATAQNLVRMGVASGTNTYAVTFNPAITSFNSQTIYTITFTNANTSTTVTLDPAGAVGATAIKDNAGVDPAVGSIKQGGTYNLRFNGTHLRVIEAVSAGHVIEDEGTPVTQRANMNFTGSGVSVTDTGGKTVVTISGGGGGGSGSAILDVSTSTVGNVTTGEDVLYTYTLPADSLNENGDILRGRISGFVANNANVKSIVLAFGGTDILSRNTTTPSIGQAFTIDWEVIRTSATTQKANATFSGSDGTASSYYTVPGETLSGSVNIVLTGEATATNDIVKETSYVYLGVGGSTGGAGGGDVSLADFIASETPTGDIDDVNDTFTLANTPTFLHVYLDGLLQEEGGGNDYTISGTTLTMVIPPPSGSKLRVSYIK